MSVMLLFAAANVFLPFHCAYSSANRINVVFTRYR